MPRPRPFLFLTAALVLLALPAAAETDRVGSLTAAIWCNDGRGAGFAARLTAATVCQRIPPIPGANQCPEFVDRVLLDFATENKRSRGTVNVAVQHFDAEGNLLETFSGSGNVRKKSAHVSIDIDRAMLDGEWLQAEIEMPKSVRKLVKRQCATGSLTVLE